MAYKNYINLDIDYMYNILQNVLGVYACYEFRFLLYSRREL